jgi:hypothetical protein
MIMRHRPPPQMLGQQLMRQLGIGLGPHNIGEVRQFLRPCFDKVMNINELRPLCIIIESSLKLIIFNLIHFFSFISHLICSLISATSSFPCWLLLWWLLLLCSLLLVEVLLFFLRPFLGFCRVLWILAHFVKFN